MDWKTHIKKLIEAGATPAQIADRIGVTANAIREILAGRTKSPRADAAFRLANLTEADFAPAAESTTDHP
ncbi:XRE family transcriptional regulator [Stenotrophomonas maltophilia]|nr:hypothetical protein DF40_003015 [Stenotrophomonas maltophilia M30]MBA0455551.1 XRE family transcriptional regulator [Stenotrophomonas maltophilia]